MHETPATPDDLPILRELGDDLKAAFRTAPPAARSPRRMRRAQARRRSWLRAGVLAAAVGIVAVIAVVNFDGAQLSPATAKAAQVLRQAASAAESGSVAFPHDHQFYYVRSVATFLQPITAHPTTPLREGQVRRLLRALVTVQQRTWTSASRTGATETRLISVKFPTPAARKQWQQLGRPSLLAAPPGPTAIGSLGRGRYLVGNIELTRRELLDFPTNPHAIYRRLLQAGHGSTAEVFTEIPDALRQSPQPARLRAALYRTLALIPGVQYVGNRSAGPGRVGTAVALRDGNVEDELIFNPQSSELLGERTIVIDAHAEGLPAGTIIASVAYLQRAVTDQAPRALSPQPGQRRRRRRSKRP
jgi:hypothetical protein